MLNLSRGNSKLKSNESGGFLIWNLPSVITCPSRTPQCEKRCYARKAERLYPPVLPSRVANLEAAMRPSFIDDMIDTIIYHINLPSYKDKPVYFRIHESGDFYSPQYFFAWCEIARAFPRVRFLAYTKSIGYVKAHYDRIPNNLIIRYSVWDDTKGDDILTAFSLGLGTFTAHKKGENPLTIICGGDCGICKLCYTTNDHISIEIH